MASKKIETLFDLLCERYEQYTTVKRTSVVPAKLRDLQQLYPDYVYKPKDNPVREPLIEHVGCLPFMAVILYDFLDRDDIDLGEAMIMLAIHDIGELKTGDTIFYAKDAEAEAQEQKEALKLLEPRYHDLYNRIENGDDPTACFAKSVDKFAPQIPDYLAPAKETLDRYKVFLDMSDPEEIIEMKLKGKGNHFTWDKQMSELFEYSQQKTLEKLKTANQKTS